MAHKILQPIFNHLKAKHLVSRMKPIVGIVLGGPRLSIFLPTLSAVEAHVFALRHHLKVVGVVVLLVVVYVMNNLGGEKGATNHIHRYRNVFENISVAAIMGMPRTLDEYVSIRIYRAPSSKVGMVAVRPVLIPTVHRAEATGIFIWREGFAAVLARLGAMFSLGLIATLFRAETVLSRGQGAITKGAGSVLPMLSLARVQVIALAGAKLVGCASVLSSKKGHSAVLADVRMVRDRIGFSHVSLRDGLMWLDPFGCISTRAGRIASNGAILA